MSDTSEAQIARVTDLLNAAGMRLPEGSREGDGMDDAIELIVGLSAERDALLSRAEAADAAWHKQDDVVAQTFIALGGSRFAENGDEPLPSRVHRMREALEAAEARVRELEEAPPMTDLVSPDMVAAAMNACASEFLGGIEWDQAEAANIIRADLCRADLCRAVAKKVLEGLAAHRLTATMHDTVFRALDNPAELDKLMKE